MSFMYKPLKLLQSSKNILIGYLYEKHIWHVFLHEEAQQEVPETVKSDTRVKQGEQRAV